MTLNAQNIHHWLTQRLQTYAVVFHSVVNGFLRQRRPKYIFTVLHGTQTRSSDENSVRPSVCPSVCHTREL